MDPDELTKLRSQLEADPNDPEIHLRVGERLYEQGSYEDAATAARRALQLGMESVEARLLLGKALTDQGRPGEAAFQFSQLLDRYPDHADACSRYESIRRTVAVIDVIRKNNPPELQLDVQGHIVILTLGGMLAPYTDDGNLRESFDRLTLGLARLLQLGQIGCVVDLSRVHFVTSFFLSRLLEWRRKLIGSQHGMAICGARLEIHELLMSSRISQLIGVVESMEEAVGIVERTVEKARSSANSKQ